MNNLDSFIVKRNLKYLLGSTILLLIFHFETQYILGIKISHFWKGLVLIYLLNSVFEKNQFFFIYQPLVFLAIIQLFNYDIFQNPLMAIVNFLTNLLFPVVGVYLLNFNTKYIKHLVTNHFQI